jgi:hypothetical protein
MYLKDRTALAEDSKSVNVVLKRNSNLKLSTECIFSYPWVGPTEDVSLLVLLLGIGWFLARDWLALYSLQLGCYLATAVYPAVA